MAKLIVTWPRISQFGVGFAGWPIRIDGKDIARIDFGKTVEIEIPSGHHQVRVGGFLRSPPVLIDADADETHHVAVGRYPFPLSRLLFSVALMLALLPHTALRYWLSGQGPLAGFESGLRLLLVPASALSLLLLIADLLFRRTHFLELRKIPGLDWTDQQIFEFMRAQSRRVRISIRQMTIVVAIVAISVGAAVQWGRFKRRDFFRSTASHHARSEEIARESEASWLRLAVEIETVGQNAGSFRQRAIKAATNADFHAALRRKYEQAAAERWLTVEPDPPQSAWP